MTYDRFRQLIKSSDKIGMQKSIPWCAKISRLYRLISLADFVVLHGTHSILDYKFGQLFCQSTDFVYVNVTIVIVYKREMNIHFHYLFC